MGSRSARAKLRASSSKTPHRASSSRHRPRSFSHPRGAHLERPVFLINPSGILFGQGARIDVAGLVASTLNLSNQDFLAGRLNFASNPLAGSVENQGSITTPSGGNVYLVGTNVSNSGIINSPQGDVILAAGQSVNILDTSTPGVRVEITASDNAAVNLGEILAQSGQIGIYGAGLRNAASSMPTRWCAIPAAKSSCAPSKT